MANRTMSRKTFLGIVGTAALAGLGLGGCATGTSSAGSDSGGSLTASSAQAGATGYDAGQIPDQLEQVPQGYRQAAEQAGTLERLDYRTYESFSYRKKNHPLKKTAWVYVPYGYSEKQRYDILYLSHGGWSNETTLMGTPGNEQPFKHIVDHAIQDGLIAPLLIVLPTYNNTSEEDSGDYSLALRLTANFHRELVNDLMPAAESKYRTYAERPTRKGFAASRDHRGFAGFSMGSVNTWRTFQYCLDYFRWFMPMSGAVGASVSELAGWVSKQGHTANDFFIYSMSGSDDFAYSGISDQIQDMLADTTGTFDEANSLEDGNVAFRVHEGYEHDADAANEYTYNGMRLFWNGKLTGGNAQATATAAAAGTTAAAADIDTSSPYTRDTAIDDVRNDEVFGDWGRLIFPVDEGYMYGDTLGTLDLAWYSEIDADMTVRICNYLHNRAEAGNQVFLPFYTDDEVADDPEKADTGLFFFQGNNGSRTAFWCAGGGFAYVGAMHDSFPHALTLAQEGYNAFAVIYRPGAQTACEDLSRAIAYVRDHAEELGVDMDGYLIGGGSAGARMADWVGTYGTRRFTGVRCPKPGAIVTQYTGLSEVTGKEPPTYACVGTRDGIADWRGMRRRLNRLQEKGIPAEFHVYKGLSHGFGLGTGTVAEGWIDDAIDFWNRQVS
jgi:enterochelin esterase-like enzyme/predicted esterase